ncbi:MAG TPA: NADH-quinone oxidoreductase subunit L [Candidatus Binataceae bacterium]|nr:NADH-quinone oxidoreductase subunit L [Candidatus Binataceae bacterium]
MTTHFPILGLMLLFPLLGFLFNLFFGARAGRDAVNFVGPGAIFAAFVVAVISFFKLLALPAGSVLSVTLWHWINAGPFHAGFTLQVDALSGLMTLIVTGVGALIHLYSTGYMAHDEDFARFFAYLNLFELSMLILVLANNLVLMFMGWEGVGLCSYLLISFWYTNPDFAYAGRKAFIANRVGDAGFLLGMFTIVSALGAHGLWSLDFAQIRDHTSLIAPSTAELAALLLLVGATGKSAQIPLYVWLPDAMAGPTPVSALIHAATMVTAGVYMIARLHFLFMLAPAAMEVVATIGALTAIYAASIAIVQPDIKKVLAYSTISQLGYMFLGVGVGAFASGIFHVMTHAFFKALLFLCAGSVMHALGGEQDMFKMGGLRKHVPITYWTMLIATIAIAAIPPFAGFFSKDQILESAYNSGHTGLWILGVVTATMTSFYMFRLIFLTFHGDSRVDAEKAHHIHESPPSMTIPLITLAALSIVGGWVGLPEGVLWGNKIADFLAPSVGEFHAPLRSGILLLSGASLGLEAAILGIVLAWYFYIKAPGMPYLIAYQAQSAYEVMLNKYYVDEFYNLIITRPLFWVSTFVLGNVVDSFMIDGIVNGAGLTVETGGQLSRRIETGNVQQYAFVYVLGVLGIVAYYLYLVTH